MTESAVPADVPAKPASLDYDRLMVRAEDVAAALRERLPDLSVKKLHKLLYYCQGVHLATFDEPLFGEAISAWDMGPVVGKLWYEEKNGTESGPTPELGEGVLNTVGFVVSRYGALTGRDLEHLTHAETPWQRANAGREPGGSVRIEREWIREYFRDLDPDEVDELALIGERALKDWLAAGATRVREEPVVDDVDVLRDRLRPTG